MKKILFFCLFASFFMSCDQSSTLKKELVTNPTTQAEKDKNIIIQYLIDNNITNAKTTDSGIYYIIENEGDGGAHPDANSNINAHYHGTLVDGTVFDSSVKRGNPLSFRLNGVIKGWQEAIPMLSKGGKGKFIVPSGLAYGPRSMGAKIKPNSVLIFDIELLDFN